MREKQIFEKKFVLKWGMFFNISSGAKGIPLMELIRKDRRFIFVKFVKVA